VNQPKPVVGKKPQDVAPAKPRLIELFAQRYSVDPKLVLDILRNTAFAVKRGEPAVTDAEIAALMIVSNEYHLNPFTREIYAFRNKAGGISPIVGIDGWVRLVERQSTYVGEEMRSGFDETIGPDGVVLGFYYECIIHRSDRKFPISRRQYYKENYRKTDPWDQMPTRMLQHRAYIQSARAAFGFGGIFDADEGEVIALSPGVDLLPSTTRKEVPESPQAFKAEPGPATEDQLELLREQLAKTGVPDKLVMVKFEVGALEDLRTDQVAEAIQLVQDNAP